MCDGQAALPVGTRPRGSGYWPNELTNILFAIAGNGAVQPLNLGVPGMGVGGQTFRIVPTNETFYCEDTLSPWPGPSYIRKLSPAMLQGHQGDILVLQCPEETGLNSGPLAPSTVWLLHWNGTGFDTWCLILPDLALLGLDYFYFVEKGFFAPFNVP
jgi:hypothetical protein